MSIQNTPNSETTDKSKLSANSIPIVALPPSTSTIKFNKHQLYGLTKAGIEIITGSIYDNEDTLKITENDTKRHSALTDEMVVFLGMFSADSSIPHISKSSYKESGMRHRDNRRDKSLPIGDILYESFETLAKTACEQGWICKCA